MRTVLCLLLALASSIACGRSPVKVPGRDAGLTTGGAGGSGGIRESGVTSTGGVETPASAMPTGGHTDPVFTMSAGGAVASGGHRDTGPGSTGGVIASGGIITSGGTTTAADAGLGGSGADGPTPVVTAVSSSSGYSCALKSDGTIRCWGGNRYGQLGSGDPNAAPGPATVWRIANATGVDTGAEHACAVLADGKVQCWGGADHGQIGNGVTTLTYSPATVKDITTATAISAGQYHNCALLTNGTLRCWGWNGDGQLGNTSTDACAIANISAVAGAPKLVDVPCHTTPIAVDGARDVRSVGAGYWHSCALIGNGTVSCWGGNSFGQLGNGTKTKSQQPLMVLGVDNAIALAVGLAHNCVVLADGTVSCWGSNDSGQLGGGVAGMGNDSPTPIRVEGILNATAISAGPANTCVVLATGTIQCWGNNSEGQLGIGAITLGAGVTPPMTVLNMTDATAVSVGGNHTCALLKAGILRCWGVNSSGQLGNGGTADSWVPVDVTGL